jgi:uncharacterized membrane protein
MTSSHSLTARSQNTAFGGRKITAGYVLTGVLVILFASNAFDPGGALGVKYVAFLLLSLSALWTLKRADLTSPEIIGAMLLFVVWPCWALVLGAVRNGDMSVGASQVTPFLFVLVLAVVLCAFDARLPLRLFYASIFSLAIVVLASFILIYLLPDHPASSALFTLLTALHEKEGYFGTQSLGDLEVPIIYFGSTLFLVPAFVYYLFVGKGLRAAVIFLAIGVTFSKAGITIALVFGAVYSILVFSSYSAPNVSGGAKSSLPRRLRKLLPLVAVAGVAALLLLSMPVFSDRIRDAWTGESETAQVRLGHFHSVMDLFLHHPSYLIVGQGVGVPFYTLGESNYVQNFEIDHLNTIRKLGLPWFIGFSAVVFYSAYKLIRAGRVEERAFGFALTSIYFAAGTNPVLTTPLFTIVMTLSYFAQRGKIEGPSQCSPRDLQRV